MNGHLPYSGHFDNFSDALEKCLVPTETRWWPGAVWTPEEFYSSGNTVFVKGKLVVEGTESHFLSMYKVEDEKIVLFYGFDDTDLLRKTLKS